MMFLLLLFPLVAQATNFGYIHGIIDGKTQAWNAVDICDQFSDRVDFNNCAAGYFTAYQKLCNPCETELPELTQNGID